MILVPVTCPYCHSNQVIKGGKTDTGKRRCLTGVDVLCSISISEAEYPNTIKRYHDSPGSALSPLSRDRHRPPWYDPARQATVPLPRATLCRSHLPAGL